MTSLEKRIQKLRNQPRGISSDQLGKDLEALGFQERKGKGSHRCYKHPELPDVLLIVPKQNPLLPTYVKQALKAIDRLMEIESDD
jgi:predicted RNA binding protein YcfA (HicA-like mRNA interferase family)